MGFIRACAPKDDAKGVGLQGVRCCMSASLPGIVLLAVNWQSRFGKAEESGGDVSGIDGGRDDENQDWVAGGGIAGGWGCLG